MHSIMIFFLATLLTLVVVLTFAAFRLGGFKNLLDFFRTADGKGIASGIGYFVLFAVALSALSFIHSANADEPDLRFFRYGKVYIGIDNTTQASPMCDPGKISNKLTSNGGVIVNLIQSRDSRFDFNAKYTHHSCALNSDNESYDALGLSLEYRLW